MNRRLIHLMKAVSEQAKVQAKHDEIITEAMHKAGPVMRHQDDQRRLTERLQRMGGTGRRVLVGPWSGEVGFELLYWIPFVTWICRSRRISSENLLVLSRGGVAPWYEHVASNYIDTLEFFEPDEYVVRTANYRKQNEISQFDKDVIRRVNRRCNGELFDLLHPKLMYQLFIPVWRRSVTLHGIDAFVKFERMKRPARSAWQEELPEDYVAVKFYFCRQFPDTAENRKFATNVVNLLRCQTEVVILVSGSKLDEHDEWYGDDVKGISSIRHLVTPSNNLDVQTRVVAGARGFVGTYGGFSYLAPYMGVSSLSFFSINDGFFSHHLDLARRMFRQLGDASYSVLHTDELNLIQSMLGGWFDSVDQDSSGAAKRM